MDYVDEISTLFSSTAFESENGDSKDFESLYKNWGKLRQQEKRRKDTLASQKSQRQTRVDTCRGVIEKVNEFELEDLPGAFKNSCKFQYGKYKPNVYVPGFTKTASSYRDVLMMSEWLVEKPQDFNENWVVVPCPKGVRTLVIACNGNTKFYNKYGFFSMACHTALPGGNPNNNCSFNKCVVLDGFYVKLTNTVYVVDVLAWQSVAMSDGEYDFRHFWAKNHMDDIPELKKKSDTNQIIFEMLPKVDCDQVSFNKFMKTMPLFKDFITPLDGLLFYHRKGHYVSGVTPLVGWLYAFMVNEVLGKDIPVNVGHLIERPIGYHNQETFIQEFDAKIEARLSKRTYNMDTSPEGDGNRKKGRGPRKNKSTANNDAKMNNGAAMKVWHPPANNVFQSWPQYPQPETIKPRLTKIRPFKE